MKYIIPLILVILTGCSENYNSDLSQNSKKNMGISSTLTLLRQKQSSTTSLERKIMLHSLIARIEAKEDYYKTSRETLLKLLPDDFKKKEKSSPENTHLFLLEAL